MTIRHIVAIDLGASSGRIMLGDYRPDDGNLTLREVRRFGNQRRIISGYDCWDLLALETEIRAGLAQLDNEGIVPDSIGIDTWGVDIVLLDAHGECVGLPVSYRDPRTHGMMQKAQCELGKETIWQRSGIQFLPFNTLYQLRAFSDANPERVDRVAHALLIPDYLHYRLTGQLNWEYTNATTTQLLNLHSGEWDKTLLQWAGAQASWFGRPTPPGKVVGAWLNAQGVAVPVIAVATHDTASAILATPLSDSDSAYLSSGTWSLMGFESRQPYNGSDALQANITNEGGAEGRYRVLKNIMGLWLLQRVCEELQIDDLCQLIDEAAQLPACKSFFYPNDERFINPASMVREIQDACAGQGMAIPQSASELARCIFDSLALLYRQVMGELAQLRGKPFTRLHIVGGGSQNHFLNQLCANACNVPVSAGPVEASTLGNIGCQLIALGEVADVQQFRQRVVQNFPQHLIQPYHDSAFTACWSRFQSLSQPTKELCL
ncbi:rhamnulokinase [Erwiniaceae bacterium BAC15a-03b]|uniref:Rhamnulokinase n=1 Tax=Winslowiella arboricola TaxID=2978220 RepID=A0A9J6Q010_9GAMM|nr:rhamnulokinase [Winslowiella arboricola]MCU5775567.1 rhamnulokinase [Winslowiella arboricola]MCU5779583.1 rhamnulokinase [Winslowiella arboricola]